MFKVFFGKRVRLFSFPRALPQYVFGRIWTTGRRRGVAPGGNRATLFLARRFESLYRKADVLLGKIALKLTRR